MISADELSDVFVEVADTLVADFDLVEFLYNLSEHAAAICDATAVGILLADPQGSLQYIAASTEQAGLVELFQLQNSEGPGYDCFQSGEAVVNLDLAHSAERWPEFGALAVRAGFQSVHAIPMRLRAEVVGTLNIFGDEGVRLEATDVRVVQALADVATIAILQSRSVHRAETLSEQLQHALVSRVAVEQAKGALSKLRGVNPDQAFMLMRSFARANQQRLGNVANAVLHDPASISELTVKT
ncbi:GAF and ANTAR domain-containing protein [Aeromicrobium sp.]|uniref:GAF and ANTAR domain-containing protein n=1 Tax=Aeromicrobium sp. TaxID=1871063 RepID=UPI002FC5C285